MRLFGINSLTGHSRALGLAMLLGACLAMTPLAGTDNLRLTDEVQTVAPENWLIGSETLDFPFQLVYAGEGAEIQFYRSEIEADDAVHNEEELRESVDRVVEDVIQTLPESRLLTSTGFYDTYRAGFVLEFVSRDTLEEADIRHRLWCGIYRHPDGHQLMFTIWGRATLELWGTLGKDMRQVQDRFVYSGPQEGHVFGKPLRTSYWLLLLGGILIIGLLFMRRRRLTAERQVAAEGSGRYWNCECGRVNRDDRETCRRCGRSRTSKTAVR